MLTARSQDLDSIRGIVEAAVGDSAKIRAYSDQISDLLHRPDEALALISEMKRFCDDIQQPRMKAVGLRRVAVMYYELTYYDLALQHTFEAARICEKDKDIMGLANSYNNLGNIFNAKADFTRDETFYKSSIEYHLKCLELREKHVPSQVHNSYLNLGNLYRSLEKYDTALYYYHLAYPVYVKTKDTNGIQLSLMNMGEACLEKGLIEKSPELLKRSRAYFQKMLDQHIRGGLSDRHVHVLSKLGKISAETGNVRRAFEQLEKAYSMSEQLRFRPGVMDVSEQLSNLHAKQGHHEKALYYLRVHERMKDTLLNEKTKSSAEQMQALFKSEQKDREIQQLSHEKELSVQQVKQQRLVIFSVIGGLLLILLLAFVLLSRYHLKKKANEQLSLAYAKIELKNRQITDSINYASRIQQAILPPEHSLKEQFRSFFLFYSPRDIVSGDFYWFTKKDHQLFFAVADCTGHGVPGALMSMIGNTLLNEIINQLNITDPGEILNRLDKGISNALRQHSSDLLSQEDGMDISLCRFHEKYPILLEYATANHSIFVKTKTEVIELYGDIYSVGGSIGGKTKRFESKQVAVAPGDLIVLSSDGFYDQFGGPKNSKFLVRNFEKLLKEHDFSEPGSEAVFRSTFETWKGNNKQTDDVLVAGFRVGETESERAAAS